MSQDYTAKPVPPVEPSVPPQPALSPAEPPQNVGSVAVSGSPEQPAAPASEPAAPHGAQSGNGTGEELYAFEQWAPEPQKPAGEPTKDRAAPVA
jgi:hypothetical protein